MKKTKIFLKGFFFLIAVVAVISIPHQVLAFCGDGNLEVDQGEMCDQGPANSDDRACSSTCQRTYCGDSITQTPNGAGLMEECDDGNQVDNDGCNNECCREGTCGNGVIDTGEQCDDGNQTNGDGCSSSCQAETANPVCGNGIVEAGESCDDGNNVSGDGCSATCGTEYSAPATGTGSTIAIVVAILGGVVGIFYFAAKRGLLKMPFGK